MTETVPASHPEPETLLDYAAGSLGEASSVLVATHLALCPQCRQEARRLEALGGALTAALEPAPLAPDALSAALARLDGPVPGIEPKPAASGFDDATVRAVPEPLRGYLGASLSALRWQWRGSGVREHPLAIGDGAVRASLIRVSAGSGLPSHTHAGTETTLVLTGAFRDDSGLYARGDVAIADSSTDHAPVATPGAECLCFAVVEGSLRLTGPVGRLFNRFLRL